MKLKELRKISEEICCWFEEDNPSKRVVFECVKVTIPNVSEFIFNLIYDTHKRIEVLGGDSDYPLEDTELKKIQKRLYNYSYYGGIGRRKKKKSLMIKLQKSCMSRSGE